MPTLEPASGKKAPNKSFNPFRPIDTLEEALDAQRAATGMGVLVALGYVVLFALQAFAPEMSPFPVGPEYNIANGLALGLAILMALWVWARRSLVGTIILTVWFLFERIFTAIGAPQTINFVSIMVLLTGLACAILGFRGHAAAARLRKAPPDAQVFE